MSDKLSFVVHKHAATSLHFDFRLEINGVMPSWAIPKGPTLDPTMRRLAMKVDDHKISYNQFEGVIEEGKYGAGPVMIWDGGYYIPEVEIAKGIREQITDLKEGERVMVEGLEKGEIKFELLGKKLKGSFALIKTKGFGPKNSWLMIKHKDKFIKPNFDAHDKKYDHSVVSQKTLDQIADSIK